jgi:hypothetical protein
MAATTYSDGRGQLDPGDPMGGESPVPEDPPVARSGPGCLLAVSIAAMPPVGERLAVRMPRAHGRPYIRPRTGRSGVKNSSSSSGVARTGNADASSSASFGSRPTCRSANSKARLSSAGRRLYTMSPTMLLIAPDVHPVGDAIGCVGRLECDLVRLSRYVLLELIPTRSQVHFCAVELRSPRRVSIQAGLVGAHRVIVAWPAGDVSVAGRLASRPRQA